jgi:predicted DCC family thiol-disulfide oxidoreductase YuxK
LRLCVFASDIFTRRREAAKRESQIFAPLRLCERYFHATTRSRKEGVSNLRAFASLRQIFTWSCGVFHVKINFFSYIMTNTTLLTDTNRVFEHPILLFDGVCNLCNAAVVTVLRHDKAGVFRFAALQSATGQKLLGAHGLSVQNLDSVVMIDGQKVYLRSDVPLEVARRLHGFWPLLTVFGLIPRSVRDAVYSFIARNRYRWWGHRETCMVPDAALRHRFYD